MSGYIRTDISCYWKKEFYFIPTISINTWTKGIEISFYFLWFVGYIVMSHIKEEDYEP